MLQSFTIKDDKKERFKTHKNSFKNNLFTQAVANVLYPDNTHYSKK